MVTPGKSYTLEMRYYRNMNAANKNMSVARLLGKEEEFGKDLVFG